MKEIMDNPLSSTDLGPENVGANIHTLKVEIDNHSATTEILRDLRCSMNDLTGPAERSRQDANTNFTTVKDENDSLSSTSENIRLTSGLHQGSQIKMSSSSKPRSSALKSASLASVDNKKPMSDKTPLSPSKSVLQKQSFAEQTRNLHPDHVAELLQTQFHQLQTISRLLSSGDAKKMVYEVGLIAAHYATRQRLSEPLPKRARLASGGEDSSAAQGRVRDEETEGPSVSGVAHVGYGIVERSEYVFSDEYDEMLTTPRNDNSSP